MFGSDGGVAVGGEGGEWDAEFRCHESDRFGKGSAEEMREGRICDGGEWERDVLVSCNVGLLFRDILFVGLCWQCMAG
jgi:hypothetical protein